MSAWWLALIVPISAMALFVLVSLGVSYGRSSRQTFWHEWSREERRRIKGDDPDGY